MRNHTTIRTLLRVAISATLLSALLARLDLGSIVRALTATNALYWLGGVALVLAGAGVSARRWQLLMAAQGIHEQYATLASVYLVGIFFNNLLPTSIGGDVYRAGSIGKRHRDWVGVAFSILEERMLGLVALLSMGCLGVGYLLLTREFPEPLWIAAPPLVIAFGITATATVLLLSPGPAPIRSLRAWALGRPSLRRMLGQSLASVARQQRWETVGAALALSILFQVIVLTSNYIAALTVAAHPPVVLFVLFVPLVVLATLIPISLNGLGVREGTSVLLWTQAGLPAETAFAMALVSYLYVVIAGVLGGIILAVRS